MLLTIFAAIIGFGLVVVIPVVAIMAEHQRKMARIMRGQLETEHSDDRGQVVIGVHAVAGQRRKIQDGNNEVLDELRSLRGEIADLRMQVASLQGNTVPPLPHDSPVRERLSQPS